jgi:hypothetical protein
MPYLSFDNEQLAAVLERVDFTKDDVQEASQLAARDGSAPVGVFSLQGQAQYQIHPMLCIGDDGAALKLYVFNNDVEPNEVGYYPDFTAALRTSDGDVLTSRRERYTSPPDAPLEVIPLKDPEQLIGARLEWVG